MYKERKIGIVILAYNVGGFVKNTIDGLPEFVDKIYVVDDGSEDNTANIIKSLRRFPATNQTPNQFTSQPKNN